MILSTHFIASKNIQRLTMLSFILFWFICSLQIIKIDSDRKKIYKIIDSKILNTSAKVEADKILEYNNMERINNFCKEFSLLKQINVKNTKPTSLDSSSFDKLTEAKLEKIIRDNLNYFPPLNQMWCLVPKAASTSWSKILLNKLDLITKNSYEKNDSSSSLKPVQVILKERFAHTNKDKYEIALQNDEILKVALVRHPFSRIYSAYQNKIKNRKAMSDGQYFYQHYSSLIIRKYRKNRQIKMREPTFEEFIDYIIDTEPVNYDEHWMPIYLLCGLCIVKYDLYIKTENLKDNQYVDDLLKLMKFNQKLLIENSLINSQARIVVTNPYQNISLSKMVLLYQKYEPDFKIFDYQFSDFYNNY